MYKSNLYRKILLLLNFIILIPQSSLVLVDKEDTNYNILEESYLNKKNIPYKNNLINNKHINKEDDSCASRNECNFNQICYNSKCYDNDENSFCVLTENNNEKNHQGNCSEPFYCENNKCYQRISYEEECEEKKYYQCTITADTEEPICRNNVCKKYKNENANFLSSNYGIYGTIAFIVFLIILFLTIYKVVTKYNEKNKRLIERRSRNIDDYPSTSVLKPSVEGNTYMRSVKDRNNIESDDQNNIPTNRNIIKPNKYKTSDLLKIIKKDSDITGNIYPKTPQSVSTLINKSYASSNNLINKKLSSQELISNSYQGNSSAAVSSPNETSVYSPSFQDFNTTNSYSYSNPFDTRKFNSFNTTHIIPSPAPASHYYSLSSPKKLLPIDIPISPINVHDEFGTSHDEIGSSSSNIPYMLDLEGAAANDDNQTTLSFDEGVIKISNTKSNNSQDCNIQETIIYSYSENNSSNNNIFYSQEINTLTNSKKDKKITY
ncbi:hypothetical protein BCR32DRAFT_328495 [Anaeromyces robustus]|uniref:EB domain-containing protein n=1 Tax=Anaeromyces robustus TaxID=1754192 RepID=A0A1Y1WZL2_9FUNG|nr:hypothetical protein BCR32DRAFT_328495 [Anaeromyces robustus]|eukprot:ORX78534.1 hypothetical protein BCR32DRAFT_328495 [Anaeromyces robustus]